MRIEKTEMIKSIKAITVRNVLKKISRFSIINFNFFDYHLNTSEKEVNDLISELLTIGYIKKDINKNYYYITSKGLMFSNATAALPLKRKTCDRLVKELLERVEIVNTSDDFLLYVEEVRLFGSYLDQKKDKINDVDFYIELVNKPDETEIGYSDRAFEHCKKFNKHLSYRAALEWPLQQIYIFLKNRSKGISIHIEEEIISLTETKIIYKRK